MITVILGILFEGVQEIVAYLLSFLEEHDSCDVGIRIYWGHCSMDDGTDLIKVVVVCCRISICSDTQFRGTPLK